MSTQGATAQQDKWLINTSTQEALKHYMCLVSFAQEDVL